MRDLARLEKRLLRAAAEAITDFSLVEEGDRIMVAVSGGKDSYTLLHVLMRLRERAPIDFELVAVNLDQGQPGYPAHVVEAHLRSAGVPYRMLVRDTYSVVRRLVPQGKTTCPVCSRLRRGVLYDAAAELDVVGVGADDSAPGEGPEDRAAEHSADRVEREDLREALPGEDANAQVERGKRPAGVGRGRSGALE